MAAEDLTAPGSLPVVIDVVMGSSTIRRINLTTASRLRVSIRPLTSAAVVYFRSSGFLSDGESVGSFVGMPLDADTTTEVELAGVAGGYIGLSGTNAAHVRVAVEELK